MKSLGLFRGKEVNKMRLGLCSRSGDIIEPMLTPQWYVNCKSMAEKSVEKVRSGELKIVPDFHEQTWFRWLDNIRYYISVLRP
jgi:valyl-tRNA synthetase